MFGWSSAEIRGRNLGMLMPEPWRSEHAGHVERYMRTGESAAMGRGRMVRGLRRSGETFPAEIMLCECGEGDGRLFAGFLRDVSALDEAQRRTDRLERRLARLDRIRALGEMATALSHELNQPLAAIAAYAAAARQVAWAGRDPRPQLAEPLDALIAETLRAGEIMRRMKRLVDRGRVESRPESINAIVREAAALALRNTPHAHAALVFDLADGLPAVMADRVQIQQVIVNLVTNAAESAGPADEDGVALGTRRVVESGPISVSATRHQGDWVRVTVRDSGPGLPEDVLGTLFRPFRSSKPSGAGVGLAICRSIVRAHGGEIWAENNHPGPGASVHFTLPVAGGR